MKSDEQAGGARAFQHLAAHFWGHPRGTVDTQSPVDEVHHLWTSNFAQEEYVRICDQELQPLFRGYPVAGSQQSQIVPSRSVFSHVSETLLL